MGVTCKDSVFLGDNVLPGFDSSFKLIANAALSESRLAIVSISIFFLTDMNIYNPLVATFVVPNLLISSERRQTLPGWLAKKRKGRIRERLKV